MLRSGARKYKNGALVSGIIFFFFLLFEMIIELFDLMRRQDYVTWLAIRSYRFSLQTDYKNYGFFLFKSK